MTLQGKVLEVSILPTGDQLESDHASGATTLYVGDATSFSETGGQVMVSGVLYTYTAVDFDLGTLTLSSGLTSAEEFGTWVLAHPASEEKWALIEQELGEDLIRARVAHSLSDKLLDGIREESERESVVIDAQQGSWVITDLIALQPQTEVWIAQALADAAAADAAAAAAQGTANTALASANSKNAITHAGYAPTNEANTLNDTWFVHDVDGTIIGQYTGMGGTTWVATMISHQVIASVDLGTATVGKLAANYIESGVLAAALTMTGYLLTGNPTGARVVIDSDGLRQYGPSNEILVNFPTNGDPAQFEGSIVANGLTSTDNFRVQGLDNAITRGSLLLLEGGTSAPTAKPTLSVGYEDYASSRFIAGGLYLPAGVHGDIDASDIVGVGTLYGYGKIYGRANKYWVGPTYTDSAGGSRTKYGNFGSATSVWVSGSERLVINSIYCPSNGATPIGKMTSLNPSVMTSSGTVEPTLMAQRTEKMDDYIFYTRMGRVLGGLSGTQFPERIAVAHMNYQTPNVVVGQITLRQYTVADTGFTQVGSDLVVATPLASGESLIGVTHGRSDKLLMTAAGTDYVWLLHGSIKTYAFNTSGVRQPDYDFNTPPGASRMMAWGDLATNAFLGFRTTEFTEDTLITKLTNNHWLTGTSAKWFVSSDWQDIDATGGTHHTTQGPRNSITVPKRAGVFVTIPPYPARPFPTTTDDPLAANVYVGRGATDPGRTFMEYVGQLTTPTRSLYIGTFAFPAGTATLPPAATSDFTASSPAKITSADGLGWILFGDGKAEFAGVAFDASKPGFVSSAMRPQVIEYSDATGLAVTVVAGSALAMGARGGEGTFVAPPSGVVRCEWMGLAESGTTNVPAVIDIELRTGNTVGSGTLVRGANQNKAAVNTLLDPVTVSSWTIFTGLTPGSVYNIRNIAYVGTAGTASTVYRGRILITPQP